MIRIIRGQVNDVVLTLSEKTTITNPAYLFEFTDQQTNTSKYFIASDTSVNKIRFNEFSIEETASEDLIHGKVHLVSTDYKYTVREQSSATNLDPTLSGGIVEIGFVQVKDATETTDVEFTSYDKTAVEFSG